MYIVIVEIEVVTVVKLMVYEGISMTRKHFNLTSIELRYPIDKVFSCILERRKLCLQNVQENY